MREIKFRGYKQKHFGCENCLGDLHEGCTELCKHKVGTMIYDCNHKLPKGWVVMQFTGLYDKNGKEVYEGDVLEFKYFDGSISRYTVKYNVGSTRSGFVFFQEWAVFDDLYEIETLGEVIGNIYENPELLDKLSSKNNEERPSDRNNTI